MHNRPGFSCFVIGQDTLLIECTEILLGHGHQVKAVISSSPRIVAWAREKGLSAIDPRTEYIEALRREPFDYLFSITHLAIIPEEAIALAKKGAINFHDGPLPRYAGLNAPAWALLQKETTYGITWHLMATSLDTGSILKQVTFDVAPDETSLSLNTKCFAQGIETFGELVTELASGNVVKTAQDLSARSYFGRHQRPEAACLIDWTRSATDLAALVRALDFGGRYANPLGVAKVVAKGETFLVTRAESRPEPANATPGSVISIDEEAIGVATGDGALALFGVSTLGGQQVSARELVGRSGVEVGWRFENVPEATRDALTALDRELGRAEPFWLPRLADCEPWEAPYAATGGAPSRFEQVPLTIAPECSSHDKTTLIAAFALYCARMSQNDSGSLGLLSGPHANGLGELRMWAADTLPLALTVDPSSSFRAHVERVAAEIGEMRTHATFLRDITARYPELRDRPGIADGSLWPVCIAFETEQLPPCQLALVLPVDAPPRLTFDKAVISEASARAIGSQLSILLGAGVKNPEQAVGTLPLLDEQQRQRVLVEWNRTAREVREACVHHLVEEQAARTPDAVALVFEDEELTYLELNERANQLAGHLRSLGVGPDRLVGIHVERSIALVVSALAVLKAGGAYVPLDPEYPSERIAFMLEDARLAVVITNELHASELRLPSTTSLVRIDADASLFARQPKRDPEGGATANHLAYVIYTSGSTGTPKGVMVEHRNVVSFFAGMDERIPHDPPGTWLAVTSLSFDISVLELFWTLARGFRVVLHRHREREARPASSRRPVDFSLFYFSSDESDSGADKYELLLEGAKFADNSGFIAVWTPERHFHAFGGLYPNPAVTGAALAVLTKHVQIRAGSVVLPLHHPVRVVEAWSIVDNLSHGRVGISFASGWQPNDFLLRPESFNDAKGALFRDLEVVKALWQGQEVTFPGATGAPVSVRTLPRPIQSELPVWITTAGNIETYKMAGRVGANVLTHLLGQSIADLAPKIAAYRAARQENGFDPDEGVVSLMLHTFVGEDPAGVRAAVREPLKRYLGSSLELLKQYGWAFPAFTRPKDVSGDSGDDLASLSKEEREAMLEHAFNRYYESSGLFGRPEDALRRVGEIAAIGVDEIACLIDFGIPTPVVLDHLVHLDRLRVMAAASSDDGAVDNSISSEIRRHRVTHLQCTPSLARMLVEDPAAKAALAQLHCWMIGGEALPGDLVRAARQATRARILNMYGPTETTVWSTTHELRDGETVVPVGRPIANTHVYVLDPRGQPVPVGAPGELTIGGDGVARGYLFRDELTQEKFVPDPFARIGRMYRTGDLARFHHDGVLEYLGRRDQQVKIRGHRIELSEIEAVISQEPNVARCVVTVRETTPGDRRLVAYVVARQGSLDASRLREQLRRRLPEFMVPSHVVGLAELPYTPNGKIDKKALPQPQTGDVARLATYAAPASELEVAITRLWEEVLGREQIGAEDNFFDVGGHSLLVVRLHRKLRELVASVTLTDLYRFPTIRSLTRYLTAEGSSQSAEKGTERASIRREMNQRRRARQAEE